MRYTKMPYSLLAHIGKVQLTLAAVSDAVYQVDITNKFDSEVAEKLLMELWGLWNYAESKSSLQYIASDLKEVYNRGE